MFCCRCPSQMDRHLLTHHTWRLQRFEMPTERGQSNDALCQILHQSNSLIVLEVGVRRDLHTSTAVTENCWLPFMICWIIPMTPPVAASFLCSLKLRGKGTGSPFTRRSPSGFARSGQTLLSSTLLCNSLLELLFCFTRSSSARYICTCIFPTVV